MHLNPSQLQMHRSLMHAPLLIASLLFALILPAARAAYAAVTLSASDIVVIGMNTDGSPDEFALMTLVEIPAGTVVHITDRGWDNTNNNFTAGGTETTVTWTPSAAVPAGTVLLSNALPGTVSGGPLSLTTSGEQLLIYQTADDNPNSAPTFIYALNNDTSFDGTEDTAGQWRQNSVNVSTSTSQSHVPAGTTEVTTPGGLGNAFGLIGEVDNAVFDPANAPSPATKADWLAALHTPSNWNTNNSLDPSVDLSDPSLLPASFTVDTDPLAVTLGYFHAVREGDRVTFTWQTATENGTTGFHLYGDLAGERTRLTTELVPSRVVDSVTATTYRLELTTSATVFYLEELQLDGGSTLHGPFAEGAVVGVYQPEGSEMTPAIYLPVVIGQ